MSSRGSPSTRRPGWSQALCVALLAALALGSAAVTAHAMGRAPAGVATAGDAPLTLPELGEDLGDDSDPGAEASHPGQPSIRVPILMYHYIRTVPDPADAVGWNLSVTPQNFEAQMEYLKWSGAQTVSLGDVLRSLRGERSLPPHAVVLTFDDGYDDFSTAAVPVLLREGLSATSFVVSGFVGRPGYMSPDQVRSAASRGMTIGAHTVHHVALGTVPLPLAEAEIATSKKELEDLLGHPVRDFAYPYGSLDPPVEQLVAAAGFADAVTTRPGTEEVAAQRFAMPRMRIGGGTTLAAFARAALLPPPPPDFPGAAFQPVAPAAPAPPAASPRWPAPTRLPAPTPRTTWSRPRR